MPLDPLAAQLLSWWLGSIDPASCAVIGLLLVARLLPLTALTPWLSVPGWSWFVALSVTVGLSVALLPTAVGSAAPVLPTGLALGLSIVRELLIGSTFAIVARLPLEAVGWAGGLAARASGDCSRASADEAPLATLYRWLALVLFVALGGAELALTRVAAGLSEIPLGGLVAWANARAVAFTFVSLCASAVTLGLVLAMPVLLGTFLIDCAQAIASRWLFSWPSTQIWLPLKHSVAVALALLSLSLLASTLPDVYTASIARAHALVTGLTP